MKCKGPCGRRRPRWACNDKGVCLDCTTKAAAARRQLADVVRDLIAADVREGARRAQLAEHAREVAGDHFDR